MCNFIFESSKIISDLCCSLEYVESEDEEFVCQQERIVKNIELKNERKKRIYVYGQKSSIPIVIKTRHR